MDGNILDNQKEFIRIIDVINWRNPTSYLILRKVMKLYFYLSFFKLSDFIVLSSFSTSVPFSPLPQLASLIQLKLQMVEAVGRVIIVSSGCHGNLCQSQTGNFLICCWCNKYKHLAHHYNDGAMVKHSINLSTRTSHLLPTSMKLLKTSTI